MIKQIKNNFLIKNTIILISANILIKILSLVNRILITRSLGTNGISLYVMILPTIMLLLTISGFSLNISVSRIIATNQKTNKYPLITIIKKACLIGIYSTLISLIIFSLTLKFISVNLLKQENAFIPLLLSMTIIPFANLNSIFRGVFNGLDNVKTSSLSTLLEQIARIGFSVVLFVIFYDKDLIFTVSITIIAMTLGEIASVIYNVISIRKLFKNNHIIKIITEDKTNTKELNKEIINLSLSQTLTHLATNISLFLEPICYNYALTLNNFTNDEIMYRYSEANAYALPLLTMFTFISFSIGTVILPQISKNKYSEKAKSLTALAIKLSFIPSIILSILLYFYSDKYMYFLYNKTTGSTFVKYSSFLYMFFYLIPIINSILISHNKEKSVLKISIGTNIIKIALIIILSFIKSITYKSLIYAIIISNIVYLFITFIYLYNILKFKIKLKDLITLILIFIATYYVVYLFKYYNVNFIISSILSFIIYLIIIKLSNIASFNNK